VACSFVFLRAACAADPLLAPATIVVFNNSIPESVELAKFYAQKRGIARDHLVGLDCSRDEEISREEYDRTIAAPLRDAFRKRKWWTLVESGGGPPAVSASTIRFVALMKGVPLKIRGAEGYPGDRPGSGPIMNRNEASVDSELSVLTRVGPEISGAVNNPYYQSFKGILDSPQVPVLLVCRLDAPAAATVRKMISDGIETEKSGLWGRAYVDSAANTSGGLEMGDQWLGEVVKQLRKAGVPTVQEETPAILPDGYPMSDVALYYGWYAHGVAGPFTQPAFRFLPGAVAVHIHSFSASTLRDPNANWVAPLLTKGAAASLGNVYEPYLQLTTNLQTFNDRLLHGFTFAESAYMAQPALSWMSVMVGDPLYRPYASWLQIDAKPQPGKPATEWRMSRELTLQNASKPAPEFRTLARQAASRARNAPVVEDLGWMEAKDGNLPSATSHFQQARSMYTRREDILRMVLAEADSWARQGNRRRRSRSCAACCGSSRMMRPRRSCARRSRSTAAARRLRASQCRRGDAA
jgi:uncharacterized protein (TIGR03790 family)